MILRPADFIIKKLVFPLCIALLVLCSPFSAAAKDPDAKETQEGPRILTADLMPRQHSNTDRIIVNFVIDDEVPIVKVTINGQEQVITSDTVISLTKEFKFVPGRNLISVAARNVQGKENSVNYLVSYGSVEDLSTSADRSGGEKILPWTALTMGTIKYEYDDNPTLDFSSPVKIGDLNIQGLVKDSEQPDYRASANVLLIMQRGRSNVKGGAYITNYSQSKYRTVDSEVVVFGGGYVAPDKGDGFLVDYLFMDIDAGGFDYSQNHLITAGYQWRTTRTDGAFIIKGLNVSHMLKQFAAADAASGSQEQLAWEYTSLDAEQQDSYRQVVSIGTSQEGYATADFSFMGLELDWNNKWASGILMDFGFGLQGRQYKNDDPLTANTPLGNTRVDIPVRLSAALGWKIAKQTTIQLESAYNVNLSNKSPWVRMISGIAVKGYF